MLSGLAFLVILLIGSGLDSQRCATGGLGALRRLRWRGLGGGELVTRLATSEGVLKALISIGAELDAADRYGVTALICTAGSGRLDLMRVLLTAGANANLKDKYGRTAVMRAARGGHLEAVELLLKAGADAAAVDEDGKTALVCAREKGHTDVVRRLSNASTQ
jgi:ankyrin repeat protein